ncbi:hypothetical protein D9M68_993260 [compost metagenome]
MISGSPSQTPVFATTDTSMNMANASRKRFGSGDYISINSSGGNVDLISFRNSNDDPDCDPTTQLCTEKETLITGTVPGARADWREAR